MREHRYPMRRLNPFIALLATLIVVGLATVAPAMAFDVSTVYRDCETHGQLTGQYSRAELQVALSNIPAQMAEYSSCQAIIQRALLIASKPGAGHQSGSAIAGAAGGRGGGSGKGQAGGNHHGQSALVRSKKTSPPTGTQNSVALTGSNIRPDSVGSAARSLPAPLLVVLILLGLTAVTGGALAIRRRVVTRQGA